MVKISLVEVTRVGVVETGLGVVTGDGGVVLWRLLGLDVVEEVGDVKVDVVVLILLGVVVVVVVLLLVAWVVTVALVVTVVLGVLVVLVVLSKTICCVRSVSIVAVVFVNSVVVNKLAIFLSTHSLMKASSGSWVSESRKS